MVLPVPNPTKSYWIEAAKSPLKDLQSTPELPKQTDIVIIGSGYTGATAAYWIHRVRSICFFFLALMVLQCIFSNFFFRINV